MAALGNGVDVLSALETEDLRLSTEPHHLVSDQGVITDVTRAAAGTDFADALVAAVAAHRHWGRPPARA
ncbi:hypothetical protein [Streptomyces sp. NPDC001165]|uniref:hypothetical protein n=1 Tax=Streptomyces sp. NPDC001165 TaxID=3364546 RepID=UPI00368F11CB